MTAVAVDTSVAVALVLRTHTAHDAVRRWRAGRDLVLSGHAAVETCSVLTRLPGDVRLAPPDAAALLSRRFGRTITLPSATTVELPRRLADLGVAGGAVHDAIVALAALEHGLVLATRDPRAADTYEAVGVATDLVT